MVSMFGSDGPRGKLVVGRLPTVKAHSYRQEYSEHSEFAMTELNGYVEEELSRVVRRYGIPSEAVMSREFDSVSGAVAFVWRWWEVTF